jgi:predicted SprT family Zn-dependent metalloprotease
VSKRRLKIAVSAVFVAVIGLGARYVFARETLGDQDLMPLYQQTGQVLFGYDTPLARVEWSNLGKEYGNEQTFNDDSIEILIDRDLVTSEKQLREVMQHEVCHVYVDRRGGEVVEHGPMFQTCISRFE